MSVEYTMYINLTKSLHKVIKFTVILQFGTLNTINCDEHS